MRGLRAKGALLGVACAVIVGLVAGGASAKGRDAKTYTNPLPIAIPGDGQVETFADPSVIKGPDGFYYAYATSDPLNGQDRAAGGGFNFHKIPMARSRDLVNWTYMGDAFTSNPAWLEPDSGVWAPDIRFFDGRYYLYYAGIDPKTEISGRDCHGEPAIGVATAPHPLGPWTDAGRPVVYPRPNGPGCDFFWTFDPALTEDAAGTRYIYFGSYYGGIHARRLLDPATSDPSSETRITIANRYEGAYVVRRRGSYYLFGSATDCCRGPLTGYSVFAGRSSNPLGPFVDREGVPLTDARVGGTPVISMNGNRWMGPGHNAVITDEAGQDWFVYHAIDRGRPYLAPEEPGLPNINRRPMLIDRLEWVNGWPSVRAGWWASDTRQPAPVTDRRDKPARPLRPKPLLDGRPRFLPGPSDEFNGALEPQRSWVRPPAPTQYSLAERPGFFRFRTQDADLFEDSNNASVLTQPAPKGDFMVEVKFDFDVPPEGCCFNYRQGGVVIYENDDAFVKNAHFSLWDTRQAEWAKEVPPGHPDQARPQRYGNTVLGPPAIPADVSPVPTWLRITRVTRRGHQLYTGYSSIDGRRWVRGGTWTHSLARPKIGLISMGGAGSTVDFDYVRVYRLDGARGATAPGRAGARGRRSRR